MKTKAIIAIMLTFLVGISAFASNVKPVEACKTVYIRTDGSIEPNTAPISSVDNITYTFTGLIKGTVVVLRDNIVLDGAGNTVQGPGNGRGIDLFHRTNVTIKNMEIKIFTRGIDFHSSSNITIQENNIKINVYGIKFYESSGIIIQGNVIETNICGIMFYKSSSNTVSENNIKNNCWCGVSLHKSSNNNFLHNNFVDNTLQANILSSGYTNFWDDGYPSGGNYWSDYTGIDFYSGSYQNETGNDEMGDIPYVVDENNQDNYPFMEPWTRTHMRSTGYPWPMFHHDLRNTGYTESPAPNTNQITWNYTTGGAVISSPSVAGGMVFVGSNDNNVYALDQYTGAHVWNYSTGGAVLSSPAVADDKVFAGSDDHKIYCLNASTGAHMWNYTTSGYVRSSAVVVNDKVFVASDDSKVYCLDVSTGVYIWSYTTGDAVESSPAVAAGVVYVGSMDDKVYCLDAADGAHVWNFTTEGGVSSSPTVAGNRVYVGSWDHKVYCLDASTGDIVWSYTTDDQVHSSPAFAGSRVYIGSWDDKVYCLDAATGTHIWNYTTEGDVSSSPAVAFDLEAENMPYDSKVYVGSLDGRIYCLDAATGAHIWNYTTGETVWSSPVVADGIVFTASNDHAVYAFGNVVRVPEDYPTIQEAINAADPGDTISIAPDTYYGVSPIAVIDKSLTLLGRIGSSPTFDGGGSGIAVIITGASEVTVTNIVVTDWDQGIFVTDSSDCKIYNSIMSSNDIAINLTESSTGITIYANTISGNDVGIDLSDSTDIIIYHNNFVNNIEHTRSEEVANIWDNGYPSGGNYWSDHTGIDNYRGPTQNELGSDGIYDNAYDIDIYNQDNYPLTKPYGGEHDIGIAKITTSKTIVGQGYNLDITVKTLNYGTEPETPSINAYAKTTLIDQIQTTLASRNSGIVIFTWTTAGVVKGNYTIEVFATQVLGETDTADNALTDGWVYVGIPGDVDGNGKVEVKDVLLIASHYGCNMYDPCYESNLDINGDGKTDVKDILIAATHYGETEP